MKHCTICGHQAEPDGQLQCQCDGSDSLHELVRLKVGTRVKTPDGNGIIVGQETVFKKTRYPIKLDDEKRYWYSPAYYWFDEVIAESA